VAAGKPTSKLYRFFQCQYRLGPSLDSREAGRLAGRGRWSDKGQGMVVPASRGQRMGNKLGKQRGHVSHYGFVTAASLVQAIRHAVSPQQTVQQSNGMHQAVIT
jgi:hypothetical protein